MASPRPVPPSNPDWSGSNILACRLGSRPIPVSRKAIRSQYGCRSRRTVSVPPSGMARRALSQRFQNTWRNLAPSILARSNFGLFFHERQRLVEQAANVGLLKIIRLLSRIVQKVCNDVIQAFRLPAHDSDQVFFILLQRNQPREFLHGTGHGAKRLPDLVSDGRRKAAERSHAFLGGDFLFQPAEFGQVLKVEDIAALLLLPRTERRNANAQEALLAGRREKINLLAQGRRAALAEQPRQPEVGTQVLQIRAAHIGETVS